MNCPACKKNNMIVVEYAGIELDHCVDCGGVWFDRDELELLLRAAELRLESLRLSAPSAEELRGMHEKKRRCPICRRRMEKVLIGEKDVVVVDRCDSDGGYWFDADELQRVILQEPLGINRARMVSYLNSVFHHEKD